MACVRDHYCVVHQPLSCAAGDDPAGRIGGSVRLPEKKVEESYWATARSNNRTLDSQSPTAATATVGRVSLVAIADASCL